MKSLANYLIAIFMFMYWVFRIMVAYLYQTGREFVAKPINITTEVIILFVTLACIIMFVKRIKLGGILYVAVYFAYFGIDLISKIKVMVQNYSFDVNAINDIIWPAIAIILSLLVMMDLMLDKLKTKSQVNTEWYYANKEYDRQLDDRADKNHYKYQ